LAEFADDMVVITTDRTTGILDEVIDEALLAMVE